MIYNFGILKPKNLNNYVMLPVCITKSEEKLSICTDITNYSSLREMRIIYQKIRNKIRVTFT